MGLHGCAVAWAAVATIASAMLVGNAPAQAACTPIASVSDISKIRANLVGDFCLTTDIDFAGTANFIPIGTGFDPFRGTLRGRDFVIRNLRISATIGEAGLFAALDGATVSDLK